MSYTCIIPFYNEGQRIFKVLDVVSKIKELSQIICVDDGSNDKTYKEIARLYKQITIIRFTENQGKSYAVKKALEQSVCDYILLIDSDVSDLNKNEVRNALLTIHNDKSINMIILRRIFSPLEAKWIRADIIFSGERILRRSDLINVFRTNPTGYQLEIAINHYMIKNHKKVFWIKSSAKNIFKRKKVGFLKGFIDEQKMHFSMMKLVGVLEYFNQIFFFGRREMKP